MKTKTLIFSLISFFLYFTFPLSVKAIDAGCSVQNPTCLGSSVVDTFLCNTPIRSTCDGKTHPASNVVVYCPANSNCRYRRCSSNDPIVCTYRSYWIGLDFVEYCETSGCTIPGTCCGGSTPPTNSPTPTNSPSPSCTLSLSPNLSPASVEIPISGQDFRASVTASNGTVNRVNFSANPSTNVSINPDVDYTSTYDTRVTAVQAGNTILTATATMDTNGATCLANVPITFTQLNAWWQTKNGDVTTNGSIYSSLPNSSFNFITDGLGGFPGIPIFGQSFGIESGTISSKLWNSNTATTQGKIFNYSYFENLVPNNISFNDVSILGTGSGATLDEEGYEWYKATSDLTISSPINIGNRKVILFVDGFNLEINGNINLNDGVGFFVAIVGGNITLDSSVTELEGIYLSDGSFTTGAGTSPLLVRGSVASYSGVTLGRSLNNNSTPAEIFEYGPDQIMLFPEKLGYRRTKWMEVAP